MHNKKAMSVLLTLCMALTLIAIAVPAQAQNAPPTDLSNFAPNDDSTDKDQLGDAFDGVDSLAHLTAVADADATQVTWYVCTSAGVLGSGSCQQIGEDTSGTQPRPPVVGSSGSDEAYDINWDIPSSLDGSFDIVSRACNGTPSDSDAATGTPGGEMGTQGFDNCLAKRESTIELDDSATPAFPSTPKEQPTGEITGVCNAVRTTSGANAQQPDSPAASPCDSPADFTALLHGGQIPADNFTLRFRTSPDVDVASACVDAGANASNEPAACDSYATKIYKIDVDVNNTDNQTTYDEWDAVFTGTGLTNNQDVDIAIFGNSDTFTAQCNDQFATAATADAASAGNEFPPQTFGTDICVLDEHYVAAVGAQNAKVVSTFRYGATAGAPGAVGNPVTCETNPDKEEANRLGDSEVVTICVLDQFNRGRSGVRVRVESTGVGTLTCTASSPTATSPATATTGETQSCEATTDTNGRATATLTNTDGTTLPTAGQRTNSPGDQTLTECTTGTAGATLPAGFTCASASAIKDTEVKHWVTTPDHIHLVFSGTGDPADPCHTGDQFTVNATGDTDTLLACLFDQMERSASTLRGLNQTELEGDSDLTWTINGPAVAFQSNPPSETDAAGQATLQIRAIQQGSSTITVVEDLTNAQDIVTKSVTQGTQTTECNDGVDNDGDGLIDFPNDPGCASVDDNTEDSDGPGGGAAPPACRNRGPGENVIIGTSGDDVLNGTSGRDIICGAGGDDVISGRGGADLITGNGGNDTIGGGRGKDTVSGNGGNDNISGNKGNDSLKGNRGNDALKGNAGVDTLSGGAGNDTLQGGNGNDVLKGGSGNDTLRGGKQDDALDGGPGRDQCFGGPGNDSIRRCE